MDHKGPVRLKSEIRRTCPLYSHTACTHITHMSGDTHTHTHTHTHAGGTTVEGVLCIFPILASSPREDGRIPRSSGRLAMRRPGTKSKCPVLSWSGTGPKSICLFLGFYGGNPGEHVENIANSTQKGPGTSPDMLHHAGLEPSTFLL